jgi:hypothetical protein
MTHTSLIKKAVSCVGSTLHALGIDTSESMDSPNAIVDEVIAECSLEDLTGICNRCISAFKDSKSSVGYAALQGLKKEFTRRGVQYLPLIEVLSQIKTKTIKINKKPQENTKRIETLRGLVQQAILQFSSILNIEYFDKELLIELLPEKDRLSIPDVYKDLNTIAISEAIKISLAMLYEIKDSFAISNITPVLEHINRIKDLNLFINFLNYIDGCIRENERFV